MGNILWAIKFLIFIFLLYAFSVDTFAIDPDPSGPEIKSKELYGIWQLVKEAAFSEAYVKFLKEKMTFGLAGADAALENQKNPEMASALTLQLIQNAFSTRSAISSVKIDTENTWGSATYHTDTKAITIRADAAHEDPLVTRAFILHEVTHAILQEFYADGDQIDHHRAGLGQGIKALMVMDKFIPGTVDAYRHESKDNDSAVKEFIVDEAREKTRAETE